VGEEGISTFSEEYLARLVMAALEEEHSSISASGMSLMMFLRTSFLLTAESSTMRIQGAFKERGLHMVASVSFSPRAKGEERG
jgi:hypothetical protein